MNEKVDILLPIYNGSKYIEEQIESLLNQTYKNIEILIRDDQSKDESKDIIKKMLKKDKRIKVIEDDLGNLGLVKNIEELLKKSTSNYIMYCDQDDYWLKEKVEKMLEVIQKEEVIKKIPILVHSDAYVTNEKLEIKKLFMGDYPLKQGLENSFFNYYVQGASTIFNRNLKNKILPFPNEAYIHDRYTHLMAELEGKRIYLKEPLMYYRQHGNNIIGSKSLKEKVLKNLNILSQKIYLEEDKKLLMKLYEKNEYKDRIQSYKEMVSEDIGKLQKIRIIKEKSIYLRLKEWLLLIIKN